MTTNDNIHAWRLAVSYCGQVLDRAIREEYRIGGIDVHVHRVPAEWICEKRLPPKFLQGSSANAVGCVSTNCKDENGNSVPCVIYDLNKEKQDWINFDESMDPVLYLIGEHLRYGERDAGIVIIQSLSNPWHIGTIFGESLNIVPTQWVCDDPGIYGIEEAGEAAGEILDC